jgi:dienelactone hydrolase
MAIATKKIITQAQDVDIPANGVWLRGDLNVPADAQGIVLFVHGSGSSRHSPRNQFVAHTIRNAGVGTLLFDLLTRDEEVIDLQNAQLRFDIPFLAQRLMAVTEWIHRELSSLRVGYFGSSTGGGAALVAAAQRGDQIGAVVSRGGRPDLAGDALPLVKSPTLLIVGGLDYPLIEMNNDALARLPCEKELKMVPGATHLFQEPGTLEQVADLAAEWFQEYLSRPSETQGTETDAFYEGRGNNASKGHDDTRSGMLYR